ncbi:bifunctional metallophosphatase/5'-nucleotidase [Gracilibacillus dipsosauri]|uniref:Bifunctional metallophosphatase/5'-nucleotidase n=1 Tax=Gracilibacillus dipsosauri TaxID=178340 RepID=A0A317KUR5_9BACI|nr:bifunctional UDP-sugar hydrolase/5'-nucleotidase [Gracilibacillus dipsosauri]PWU67076.1 bifunctional metallophosphatase/5'-nucleotidase [Gracilibacillus dipsosauri]
MTSISICVTSDIHGYIYPTNYREEVEKNMGLAKIASLIDRIRSEKEVILVDNGDFIQGSPFTYYFAAYKEAKRSPLIKIGNSLLYDMAIFGNHEFNYGIEYLKNVVNKTNYPWLAANILDKHTGEPFFGTPYVTKEINGIKITFLGITTHFIPHWEDPTHIRDLVFEDACEAAHKWVKKVREEERPDLLVVSYHGGVERDPETGEATEALTGENQAYQMCEEITGIDLLITGHQHRFLTTTINGVPIIQTGSNGKALGEIELAFNNKKEVTSIKPKLHYVKDDIRSNQPTIALIEEEEKLVQEWLDQPITEVKGDMEIKDPFQARIEEHPFIEYINTLQMKVADVDISCTALFHNQSPGFPKHVTMRDIVSNYVYPNTLKVLKLRGKDIKEAIEKNASYFTLNEAGELAVNSLFLEPKPEHYNYDMWEGIEYELNIANPIGNRVTKLLFQNKALEMDRFYSVVMNNYRASGGGNYDMFRGKEIVKDIPIDMTELIANDLLNRNYLEAKCNHNFSVVVEK